MTYISHYTSPLGTITVAAENEHLTGLWLPGQKYFASTLTEKPIESDLDIFQQTRQWLDIYFRGDIPSFTPPIRLIGTPFRLSVWNILLKIPYGKTVTYGDIAKFLAAERGIFSMSAQAVGGAVGHNPISIIVPCHRVVGSDGNLTGYAGGLDKKIQLLTLEKADILKKRPSDVF